MCELPMISVSEPGGVARSGRVEAQLPVRCADAQSVAALLEQIGGLTEPEAIHEDKVQFVPRLQAARLQLVALQPVKPAQLSRRQVPHFRTVSPTRPDA